ncbi:MAG: septum formation initiator family protein [bacterium]
MQKKRKNNQIFFLLFFSILALLLYLFGFSKNGYWEKYKLSQQIKTIKKEIKIIEENNLKLKKEISTLKNNNDYIEEIARQELKMIKPGEIVYKINFENVEKKNKNQRKNTNEKK